MKERRSNLAIPKAAGNNIALIKRKADALANGIADTLQAVINELRKPKWVPLKHKAAVEGFCRGHREMASAGASLRSDMRGPTKSNSHSEGDTMSNRATDFTGSIPVFYDHGLGPVFFSDFADDIARRAASSAPMRVLEIAAGTGIVTRRLRDLLPRGAHLVATDLNPPMLEVARSKFRPDEMVKFQPADATALPFPDASFDAVVCQFGVMFFPDKDKSYREAHRVLLSGGRYLFSVWDSHRQNPHGRLITDILVGFFPHDPPQFYQVPFGYHRIDPIKDSLEAAGFTDLRIEVLSLKKIVPDVPTYARALVLGNPLIEQIRARGGVDPERVIEALEEAIPREFGTDPVRIPLQAIVFEARRGYVPALKSLTIPCCAAFL